MISIRIHGRGGQGVKKSAQILARASHIAGYKTQDFAVYGAERKGAPVTSFVRIDKKKINTRGYVWNPDFIIVLDDSLELSCHLTGRKKTTKEIINTTKKLKIKVPYCKVDATSIAVKELGKNIPNVATLGAFIKIFKIIKLSHLEKAVEIEIGKKHPELVQKNIRAAKECYKKVVC
ncbi:2-oxoacid:acceptor oxidoreductase family protein [Candidatus Woesearchaeota archaeon]|nr:2-oxoacid:acceptor oxidoreductase family protein [Candidatus Woesearchaeota archaeon]